MKRNTQHSKQKSVTQIRSSAHAISFFDHTLDAPQTCNWQESSPHYQQHRDAVVPKNDPTHPLIQ